MTGYIFLFFSIAACIVVSFFLYQRAANWVLDWLDAYNVSHSEAWQNIELRLAILAKKARIALPSLYILPEFSPNAMVLSHGYGRSKYFIVLTEGLINTLTHKELDAVLCLCLAQTQSSFVKQGAVLSFLAYPFCWFLESLPRGFWFFFAPLLRGFLNFLTRPQKILEIDKEAQKLLGSGAELAAALQKIAILSKKMPLRRWSLAFDHLFLVSPLQMQSEALCFFPKQPSIAERREKILARTLAC